MEWFETLAHDYLESREKQVRSRLYTFTSWNKRSSQKTRNKEMQLLLKIESEFNKEWIGKIKVLIMKKSLKPEDLNAATLTIESHLSKQKGRTQFLIITGILIALVSKFLGGDIVFSIILVGAVIMLLGERLYIGDVTNGLEELKKLIEHASDET